MKKYYRKKYNQSGGVDPDAVPPHIIQGIINQLTQEVYSYVTIGFTDDDDIPLTYEQFEDILTLPEIRNKLNMIVDELKNDYIADHTEYPFEGDAYREWLSDLGVYDILNSYRVPSTPETETSD